jgi:hypothetical protein
MVIRATAIRAAHQPLTIKLATYPDPITECNEYKCLGFIFQNDLSWSKQLAYSIKKAQGFINRIKRHYQQFNFISPVAGKRIWTTYGRPLLEHGMPLWATTPTAIKTLEKIQQRALKAMCPCHKSTNRELLLLSFDLPSMRNRIESARFAFRKKYDNVSLDRPHRWALLDIKYGTILSPNLRAPLLQHIWAIPTAMLAFNKWVCRPPAPASVGHINVLTNSNVIQGTMQGSQRPFLHSKIAWNISLKDLATVTSIMSRIFGLKLPQAAAVLPPVEQEYDSSSDTDTEDDLDIQNTCPFCNTISPTSLSDHCLLKCNNALQHLDLQALHDQILTQHPTSATQWNALTIEEARKSLVRAPFATLPSNACFDDLRLTLCRHLITCINKLYSLKDAH